MGLRPLTTHWFEVLVAGGHVATAAEALARTGRVQIELKEEVATPPLPELSKALERYAAAARRYGPYWPCRFQPGVPGSAGLPHEVLTDGLARLDAWASQADAVIEELQRLEQERSELALVRDFLEHGEGVLPDLELLHRERNALTAQLLLLPAGGPPLIDLPPVLLRRTIEMPEHVVELVVAAADEDARIAQAADAAKARRVFLPAWLPPGAQEAIQAVDARLSENDARADAARRRLEELRDEHDVCRVLNDMRRLEWYVTQVPGARHTRNFAVLSGWTDDASGASLEAALAGVGVDALVHFPPAPPGSTPPVIVSNPAWAKPFELFSKMLGVPATGEVDPAMVLGLIAPLLFGYMFGDVGHGAILLVAGIVLHKRYPQLRILIGGGIAAVVFGFVFGSVFCREDILPALWVHPMEAPLSVLEGSIYLGAAILMLGILLHGLSAVWRRQLAAWLRIDLTVALIYVGVLGMFLDERFAFVAIAGAGWAVLTQLIGIRRRRRAVLKDVGETVEHSMRIAVNTVSFVRVGAFALAHAGLATAVASLASGISSPFGQAVVLILGNALVLVLEGIVVSIQMTRLILFEFFVRFLAAEGRPFQPLAPPARNEPTTTNEPPAKEPPAAPPHRAATRSP